MIQYKTAEDIQLIKEGAQILGKAHGEVAKAVKPGVQTKELDKIADEYIMDHGGLPSFKDYNGFPAALCISVNETVVHGFPGQYELKESDVISVDCGVSQEVLDLLDRTYDSLFLGIEQAKPGNRIGDISFAIQNYVEQFGYGVVRELVGHGVGKDLHEDPEVPNYGKRGRGPKITPGMVFAIEPMINLGTKRVVQENDGWTIRTADRKPSAHFEHTVAILEDKVEVLTTHEYIERNYKYKWRNKSR